MAALIVWAALHKAKVSGSPLSNNFLVLVPNLTVQDRVSGATRGDGLDPAGANSIYTAMDLVPPEYAKNSAERQGHQLASRPLENRRDDWIGEDVLEEGRFVRRLCWPQCGGGRSRTRTFHPKARAGLAGLPDSE